MLFNDPEVRPIAAAINAGRLRWFACPSMRAEFSMVVHRGNIAPRRNVEPTALLAAWDAAVSLCPDPRPAQHSRLECTDRDDQPFIDLAVEQQARWLFTRDKALLHLAAAALTLSGLLVVRPTAFIET